MVRIYWACMENMARINELETVNGNCGKGFVVFSSKYAILVAEYAVR